METFCPPTHFFHNLVSCQFPPTSQLFPIIRQLPSWHPQRKEISALFCVHELTWLASVAETVCNPSQIKSKVNFGSLSPGYGGLLHHWDLTSWSADDRVNTFLVHHSGAHWSVFIIFFFFLKEKVGQFFKCLNLKSKHLYSVTQYSLYSV